MASAVLSAATRGSADVGSSPFSVVATHNDASINPRISILPNRSTPSILVLVFCLGQFGKRHTPLLISVEKSPRFFYEGTQK